MVQDHYLIVHRWRPFFLQNVEVSSKVAVWIKIPKLPLKLYNSKFLCRVGSALGTMLQIDKVTSIHSRGKFARIYVEIDLAQPLTSHLMVRGHKLLLEYEGLHQICFRCGRYGHKREQCSEPKETQDNQGGQALVVLSDKVVVDMSTGISSGVESSIDKAGGPGGDKMSDQVAGSTVKSTLANVEAVGFGPWMVSKK